MRKIIDTIERMHTAPRDQFTFKETLLFVALVTGIYVFGIGAITFFLLSLAKTPWFLFGLPFTIIGIIICVVAGLYTVN